MSEDQITALFHEATAAIQAPTAQLVDHAVWRGRRRRRATRAAILGTAAVLMAAITVLGLNAYPASTASRSAGPAATPRDLVTSAARPSSTPPPPVAPTVFMTPQALLQTLLDLLPRAVGTSHYGGNFDSTFSGTQLRVDDGRGAAAILLGIFGSASSDGIVRCAAKDPDCTVLPDGTTVQIDKHRQYEDGRAGPNPIEWDVTVVRSNGNALDFYEYNAPEPKGAALTRAEPPFSTRTVTRWLLDARFSTQISQARARRAHHLFRPIDLDAQPAAARTSPSADRARQRRNCTLARSQHKTAPTYC